MPVCFYLQQLLHYSDCEQHQHLLFQTSVKPNLPCFVHRFEKHQSDFANFPCLQKVRRPEHSPPHHNPHPESLRQCDHFRFRDACCSLLHLRCVVSTNRK